jgi:hypothetical protein
LASELMLEAIALQLRGTKLGLEVNERPLDFDVENLLRPDEREIGRTPTISDGLLDAWVPSLMSATHDELNGLELPAVSQSHALDWIELYGQLMTGRRCQRGGSGEVRAS